MTNIAHRPTIAVTRHAIAAGHYLASTAGFDILQAGGNAIDAGVTAGIALGVLQSDLVNCAGVAPIMIYLDKLAVAVEDDDRVLLVAVEAEHPVLRVDRDRAGPHLDALRRLLPVPIDPIPVIAAADDLSHRTPHP